MVAGRTRLNAFLPSSTTGADFPVEPKKFSPVIVIRFADVSTVTFVMINLFPLNLLI